MLLPKEFVRYLSRQLVKDLVPRIVETTDPEGLAELTANIIIEELEIEDRLNEEVREILSHYADYIRREGISYMEMFRRIKNKLIAERKIVRASGRETGDDMKLSRDKINEISHKLITAWRRSGKVRFKRDANDVRLEIVQQMINLLKIEEKVDKLARQKILSQRRNIPEGSEEWALLHRKYYAEELKRFGIDLNQ